MPRLAYRLLNSKEKEAPMKAVVFYGVGDIRIDEIDEPKLSAPTDALVRLTSVWSNRSGRKLEISSPAIEW
jgi:hypothetical protein